ncbi:MAG: proton-conducting transporter membrane subunit [Polyangia bacterium]
MANLLWLILFGPLLGAGLCRLPRTPRAVLVVLAGVVGALALAAAGVGVAVMRGGALVTAHAWLRLDALSAFHLLVLAFVFLSSTLFAVGYFTAAGLSLRQARGFAALWLASLAAMTLVLVANHLGLLWVGVETTTLVTTFLIAFHRSRESLEATWKYLMICSVGIAIAFLGMLVFGAAASHAGAGGGDVMLWTTLRDMAGRLDPKLAKLGFIFLLVGYGTKVGLAPMHTWLPDAHSQAPAPVSSMFSAAMLSTVLYCLMRYLPVVDAAAPGFAGHLLCLFGVLSMIIAAAFILFQRNVKRMLAYCSVEHIGIVAIALGLGGLGAFAAMFHTLNHSLAKSAGFFAAGRLGQRAGSYQIARLRGSVSASPLWGMGLCLSLLALIGVVPSAIFASELMVVKAAAEAHASFTLVAFLVAGGTVFLGMFAHAMSMARKSPEAANPRAGTGGGLSPLEPERGRVGEPSQGFHYLDFVVLGVPLLLLAVLGVWMPAPLRDALAQAAAVVRPPP